jgi:hypothetical protein
MGNQEAKIRYFDGSEYFGETKNEKEHGEGRIVYANGDMLEGRFTDG